MKKSTGVILVLIIVLLLGVIGVGGYFYIKENNNTSKEIGELKNEVTNLEKNVENATNQPNYVAENTTGANTDTKTSQQNTKSYSDVKGTYQSEKININDGNDSEPYYGVYDLILSEDGTFAYYHLDTDCHYVGYYTIVKDKLTLYSVVSTGNDPSASLSNLTTTLTIKEDGTIVDSEKKFYPIDLVDTIKFTRTSEKPREDTNIANVIDHYLAGCGTSGKDGQGPWFTGLSK